MEWRNRPITTKLFVWENRNWKKWKLRNFWNYTLQLWLTMSVCLDITRWNSATSYVTTLSSLWLSRNFKIRPQPNATKHCRFANGQFWSHFHTSQMWIMWKNMNFYEIWQKSVTSSDVAIGRFLHSMSSPVFLTFFKNMTFWKKNISVKKLSS